MPAPWRLAGRYDGELLDSFGNALPGTSVAVYLPGTATLAALYTDATKTTAAANPVTAAGAGSKVDARGNLAFYADPGEYDISVDGGSPVRVLVPLAADEVATLGPDGKLKPSQTGTNVERVLIGRETVQGLNLAGGDPAGNKAILDTAIGAIPDGGEVQLPHGVIAFDPLASITKTSILRGRGWSTTVSAAKGDAQWTTAGKVLGTVLRPVVAPGQRAISCPTPGKKQVIEDLALVGPGAGIGLTIGDPVGTSHVRDIVSNVLIANFDAGWDFNVQDGWFPEVALMGCDTGLRTVSGPTQCVFANIIVQSCGVRGLDLTFGSLMAFLGGTMQGNPGSSVYINGPQGCRFTDIYFENPSASWACDVVAGGAHQFYNCHWGGAGTNDVRFGVGASASLVMFPESIRNVEDNGANNTFIGNFPVALTGTSASGVHLFTGGAEAVWRLRNRDVRIASGKRFYFETTGTNSYIGRDTATGDTVIGTGTAVTQTPGSVAVTTVGRGVRIKEGTNAKQGVATLVAGTVTVANTSVTASSRIFLTVQSLGTVTAPKTVAVTARTAGTSFTITSADATDTSVVAYEIFESA